MNYKLFKNISLLLISLTNLELQNQSHYFPNGPRINIVGVDNIVYTRVHDACVNLQ